MTRWDSVRELNQAQQNSPLKHFPCIIGIRKIQVGIAIK